MTRDMCEIVLEAMAVLKKDRQRRTGDCVKAKAGENSLILRFREYFEICYSLFGCHTDNMRDKRCDKTL